MPDTVIKTFNNSLLFIPNEGQADSRARFCAAVHGSSFFFQDDRITSVQYAGFSGISAAGAALELSFIDANAGTAPEGYAQSAGHYNYFTGGDSTKWRTHLPAYGKLKYEAVWDGVDLELEGSAEGLKFNWLLQSADRVGAIRLRWEGAKSLSILDDGSLCIRHNLGALTDPKPAAWQEIGGISMPVDCVYCLDGGTEVSFELRGPHDPAAPLLIDPVIQYSTYLGGSAADFGNGIAVDGEGCAYVSASTLSADFPVTPGAFQTTLVGKTDVFVTKFAVDGANLVYSTYLGGTGNNTGFSLAIDAQGCAYVTGNTNATDFPVTPGAFQTTYGGGTDDAFVTKLAPDGASLVYSTYLGGINNDSGNDIAVDALGCAYVGGFTYSADFPVTPGAFQIVYTGTGDAFATKLAADGGSLVYSSYLNGSKNAASLNIAVDARGCAYLTGITDSTDFPVTPGAFQTTYGGGVDDAFVTKFSADGASLVYSTYLGGDLVDSGSGICVDAEGIAYVTGSTSSANFPVTPGAFQTAIAGAANAFITKLAPSGGSLLASTYLGGSLIDSGNAITVDMRGHVYVAGNTISDNFPTTPAVLPSQLQGDSDAFVSILTPDLRRLLVSYYLGGSGSDYGDGIVIGGDGGVYVVGDTSSTDFPVTPGAFQTTYGGGDSDCFLTKAAFVFYEKVSIVIQGIL